MNIAVFASHNGSDLQAIIDACENKVVNAKVCAVLSNNGDSKALERAGIAGIDNYHVSVKVCGDEDLLDSKILDILDSHEIDIIFLAGYLKKIGSRILRKYHNRIFNIHPALLPKFGGKGMYGINVHKAVIDAKEPVSGITAHRVSENYDEGEIVAQTSVEVLENDTPETLAERILAQEHIFIVEVLKRIISGEISTKIYNRRCCMSEHNKLPTREEAENLLIWAHSQNPGPWADHCRVVARVTETLAKHCGLDSHKAYVQGLLHDIGRYEGVRGLHHIYAGYELMNEKGYTQIADICLSHSFPYQDLGAYSGGDYDCTESELSVITSFLSEKVYDDCDKLVQLGDSIGSAQGVCLIDVRLLDVARRHGFNDFTLKKWDSIFALKEYFDKLCNKNIYDLFYQEIREVSFR